MTDQEYKDYIDDPAHWSDKVGSGIWFSYSKMKYNGMNFINAYANISFQNPITMFEEETIILGRYLRYGTKIFPIDLEDMINMMRYTDERKRVEENI